MNPAAIKGQITKLNKELAALAPGQILVKENLHAEVYHGADGVSNSKLKVYRECPAKYQARFLTGELEATESRAFDLGKAAHGLILEPEKFHAEFVRQPDDIKVRRGKVWDAFKEKHADKVVIAGADWEACQRIRSSVERSHFGAKLLNGGKAEVSYFKRDEETGLVIKCRADYVLEQLLVDVKTAVSAHPDEFARKAKALGYHLQAAMYSDITGIEDFAFLAVEKEPPYVVTAPIMFEPDALRLGYLQYRDALRSLAESLQFNHFPGYTTQPVFVGLKPWELSELEKLEEAA